MFNAKNNVFLPESLVEFPRTKKCRKYSFRKKTLNIEPVCIEQNTIRAILRKIRPKNMKPIEDPHFGIDYSYNGITIDQKFSFGALGENTIKIRVQKRGELMNKSNWTMIINSKREAELFPTEQLASFVKKNWGIIQKRLVEKKYFYSTYAVNLEEFYKNEETTPIKTNLSQEELQRTLNEISQQQEITQLMRTTNERIDHTRRICFGGIAIGNPTL